MFLSIAFSFLKTTKVMFLAYCFVIIMSLVPASCMALRIFSAFRTIPPKREKRVSSVFIGQLHLDIETPCTLQPILYTTFYNAWDTRQVFGPREGLEVLFPLQRVCDIFGQDTNAHGQFTMNAFESGLGFFATGPHWGNYAASVLVASDFVGGQETSLGAFRLYECFAKFDFPRGNFFIGQLWHPLVIPDCFPQTVSFSDGSPLEPRTRCPQLKYYKRIGSFDFSIAATSQGQFVSPGPIGPSFTYFSNSVIPAFYISLRKHFEDHQVGVGVDFKRLVPRLVSEKNVRVNEYVDSYIVQTWAAFNFTSTSIRMKCIYAQNAADHIMLSGYAVRTIDPITDARTYSPTASINGWIDTSYVLPSKTSEIGLFGGVGKNLGSRHRLEIVNGSPIVYPAVAFVADIDLAWRISPRFVWTRDPLRLGIELEVTGASYGTLDAYARAKNSVGVTNYRILGSFYYVF